MKRIYTVLLVLVLLLMPVLPVAAADASVTDTFTHWTLPNGQQKAVTTRPIYEVAATITARSLGMTEDLGTFIDVDADTVGNLYLLTDIGRLLCIRPDGTLGREYNITDTAGQTVNFAGAKGISVLSETELYIADTNNARVLYCVDGVVQQEILLPDSPLIAADFVYKPIRVARDNEGYLYVLSEGSYYGAVLYTPEGVFSGFFGANTVKGDILSALSSLWDRLTMTEEKMANSKKKLPYQFADITIDSNGFVYTCTASTTGQIRMLSPGGAGILSDDSRNFGEEDIVKRYEKNVTQSFVNIQADGKSFIYALDQTYGLIYIYDIDGNMIAAFGGGRGQGKQQGVFSSACAMALHGNHLYVADMVRNSVTVFELTEFGDLLLEAQRLTLTTDYAGAEQLWQQVLKQDATNRSAICGLAKAAYMKGDYESAAAYAKRSNEVTLYSQARDRLQSAFVSANFIWIFPVCLVAIAVVVALILISVKRQLVLIPHIKVRTMTQGMFHPFRSFRAIKEQGLGSLLIAGIMTALFFLSSAAATIWSDFRYTDYDTETYNALFQLLRTVGLILLWSVANWAVSTLMEGKGRLKEVFIVTSYSTLPVILYNVLSIPLTHLVSSSNSALIAGFETVSLLFVGIMLCIGLMITHDFSFPRFLFSAVVTVLFMILGIFVLFMFAILLSQFWSFLANAVLELIRWQ